MDTYKDCTGELAHFRRTHIPRCQICKKNYIKQDHWTWKPNCEHNPNLRISVG